jgi:hypothetical protein
MNLKVTSVIYFISSLLITILGIASLTWGYNNSSFPNIQETETVIGTATDIELHGWEIKFKIRGHSKDFSYFRYYGNFETVKESITGNEWPKVKMIVEKPITQSYPNIYGIVINDTEITNFEDKKSKHDDYTKSIYWFSIGLIFLGIVGFFMGVKNRRSPVL